MTVVDEIAKPISICGYQRRQEVSPSDKCVAHKISYVPVANGPLEIWYLRFIYIKYTFELWIQRANAK